MRELGMSEQEIRRAQCEHDFGDRCEVSPFGKHCIRTCVKCGQKIGLGGHCWELKEQREAKAT